jgi:hypothetical protein
MPWARDELSEHELAENGDAVRPIESDGADVEDTSDGGVGTEADQVDDNAPKYGDPDCVEGRAGLGVDFCPDAGEWKKTVTGEGEDGSAE